MMPEKDETVRPASGRDPTLVLIALALVVLLSGILLAIRTVPSGGHLDEEQLLAGVVRRAVIDVDHGEISVSGSIRSGARITRSTGHFLAAPDTSATLENGVLVVRSRCNRLPIGCNVDHDIEVPATASLEITSDTGDITIRNFASSSRVTSNIGGIVIQRLAGESLEVETIQGDVKADGLAMDSLVIRTELGAVAAALKSAPTKVDIATATGGIDLAVPSLPYRLRVTSGTGKVTVTGIDDEPAAMRSITLHSQAGRIRATGI